MTPSVSRARGGSSAALLRAVLCLYVLAAALMPLGHHDIACHLKSSTHCTTCVVGNSADLASHSTAPAGCGLAEAGLAVGTDVGFIPEVPAGPSAGRAPPVL
jgi:hypothetical protein